MGQVWAFEDRVNEGILADTDLGKLGIAPACIAPGECASSHSHTLVEEINIIRSGTGTLQIEDEIHDVCAGSVGVIPAGKFHELKNTGDENLEFIAIFNSDTNPDDIVFLEKEAHFAAKERSSCVKMLSYIAAGEARAAEAFKCWAQKTRHDEFAKTLNVIAIREAEHALAFEKRLCELGYPVDSTLSAEFEAQMKMYESDAGDVEKLECFGAHKEDFDDPFDDVFKDKSIDPQTGALLGRYIAEERDSIGLLQNCYKQLSGGATKAVKQAEAADVSLGDICEAVTSLTGMVAALQADVAAMKGAEPAMKAPPRKAASKKANGRAKAK